MNENRDVTDVLLVPKLYLGTQLLKKLYFKFTLSHSQKRIKVKLFKKLYSQMQFWNEQNWILKELKGVSIKSG